LITLTLPHIPQWKELEMQEEHRKAMEERQAERKKLEFELQSLSTQLALKQVAMCNDVDGELMMMMTGRFGRSESRFGENARKHAPRRGVQCCRGGAPAPDPGQRH
jgi:hypothetical protein